MRRSPWARIALGILAAAVLVGVVVGVARSGADPSGSTPAPAGAGGTAGAEAAAAVRAIQRVSAGPMTEAGRPVVFLMGAQFCPFCAAERWAFVKATSRFGTWGGLGPLTSQRASDGFDTLPTYDLLHASYASDLIFLHHKEIADSQGNPLEPLVGIERDLVDRYDPSGGFPFIAITGDSGQFTVGLAYSPALLQGRSFADVEADVSAATATPTGRSVNGEADAITALICKVTHDQPASACNQSAIRALEATLP